MLICCLHAVGAHVWVAFSAPASAGNGCIPLNTSLLRYWRSHIDGSHCLTWLQMRNQEYDALRLATKVVKRKAVELKADVNTMQVAPDMD
jgi:hypothetical protein